MHSFYKIFLIWIQVKYFQKFFSDLLNKHLTSSKYRKNLTNVNTKLLRKNENSKNRNSKNSGRKIEFIRWVEGINQRIRINPEIWRFF